MEISRWRKPPVGMTGQMSPGGAADERAMFCSAPAGLAADIAGANPVACATG
jgi:hypothetical protein